MARGPGNTLMYNWATPGSPWRSAQVAGARTTYSVPSLFVRPGGEADVAVQGPDFSLMYYWAMPGSGWRSTQLAGPGTTYSAPSVVVRPDGRADIVARGPDFSLAHYWATPGSAWHTAQVAGAGTVGYIPSVFVRPGGRADVVTQGPDSSLVHYWATPGSAWRTAQVAGPRTTYSAPSVAVRLGGQADIVVRGRRQADALLGLPGSVWRSAQIAAPARRSPLRRRRSSCAPTAGPTWSGRPRHAEALLGHARLAVAQRGGRPRAGRRSWPRRSSCAPMAGPTSPRWASATAVLYYRAAPGSGWQGTRLQWPERHRRPGPAAARPRGLAAWSPRTFASPATPGPG